MVQINIKPKAENRDFLSKFKQRCEKCSINMNSFIVDAIKTQIKAQKWAKIFEGLDDQ